MYDKTPREIVLFYAPAMQALAEAISERSERVGGQKIRLGRVDYPKFGNGFTHPIIHQANKLSHADVAYLMSFDTEADIYVQMSVARWIARRGPHSLTLLLPFLQNATMDRSDSEDDVCTAETIAAQFLTIPAVRGPVPIWIMDIHALQEMNYFPADHVTPWLDTSMNLYQELFDPADTAIVFPDDGAYKRYKNMFRKADGTYPYPFIVCGKRREGENRIVYVMEGDPSQHERLLIVDDMTHTAGTLVECKRALETMGGKRISAAIAHADFDRDKDVIGRIEAAGFESFNITDSCPLAAAAVKGRRTFRVSTICDLAIRAIMRGAK